MTPSQTQERVRKLGTTIQAHRIAQKLTQDRLAKMVGTSQTTIARIEAGKHSSCISTYMAIADGLGLKLGDLIDF